MPAIALLGACAALLLGIGTAGPRAVDLIESAPVGPSEASGPGRADAPTDAALGEIPEAYLEYYVRFGTRMGIDWRFLAAIGGQESDHGRAATTDRVNRSGCVGPMQLGIGGECGNFVGEFGRDGDSDGKVDPLNTADAIATAAYGLRAGKGAPPPGGTFEEHRRAACRYFGACATPQVDYANEVMDRAVRYGFGAEQT